VQNTHTHTHTHTCSTAVQRRQSLASHLSVTFVGGPRWDYKGSRDPRTRYEQSSAVRSKVVVATHMFGSRSTHVCSVREPHFKLMGSVGRVVWRFGQPFAYFAQLRFRMQSFEVRRRTFGLQAVRSSSQREFASARIDSFLSWGVDCGLQPFAAL
jgi:hypothetical protein